MTESSGAAPSEATGSVPAAARERLRRMQAHGDWSAQLSAGEHAALRGVGFSPVGQVMGASVWSLNNTGRGTCGGRYLYANARPARSSASSAGGYGDPRLHGAAAHVGRRRTPYMQTLAPLVDAFTRCRRAALRDMQDEAASLGADGVVGVRLTVAPFAGSAQRSLSFVAVGTAVRGSGRTHLDGPFLSDLGGQDLALLLRAGWAPTGLVLGVGAVVAHDSYGTVRRRRVWAGNLEIMGYSDLATQARVDARSRLNADIALHGGQAAVIRDTFVAVHEQKCTKAGQGSSDVDHLVEAVLLGTSITRFDLPSASQPPVPLPMLRLSERSAVRAGVTAPAVTDPFTMRRGR